MATAGARRSRATVTWVAVSVAIVVLIPLVGLAALVVGEKAFYGGCGSPSWQAAVEAEARAVLPPGAGQFGASASDCDDNGIVDAGFSVPGSVPAALDAMARNAEAAGWSAHNHSDLPGPCLEKQIDGVSSSMLLVPSRYAADEVRVVLAPSPCT